MFTNHSQLIIGSLSMILVTAGIIKRSNKYLIIRKWQEDKWQFPGGRIQENETPEECLKRVLKEDFCIETNIRDYLCSSVYHYKKLSINVLAYNVDYISGSFTLKDYDKIMWIDINELNQYDFADADLPIIKKLTGSKKVQNIYKPVNIPVTDKYFNPELTKGQVLSNKELYEFFKTKPQGGMRRSNKTNSLVLISKKIKGDESIYYNSLKKDGLYHYTGMGQLGDQSLTYRQNKTLAESNINGINLFLFEVYQPKEYTFLGRVKLEGQPYQEIQLDAENNKRNVWIFPLKIIEKDN